MAEATVTIPEATYEEIRATLKEARASNDKVLANMEQSEKLIENMAKEIRFLSWSNEELKQRIAVLEGRKGNPEAEEHG